MTLVEQLELELEQLKKEVHKLRASTFYLEEQIMRIRKEYNHSGSKTTSTKTKG